MPRILVADDNTNIQKMVALAFQGRGIEVTSVGNGEAAVRRIPDLNPDLVLADIFMPVRNGYELCEWIKKDPKFSHIPVLLLVGAFDPLDEKEARRVGADGVLKKPFIPPDPLIAMVVSALEKNPKIAAELHQPKEPAVSQQHQQPAALQAAKTPLPPAASAFAPTASAVEIPSRITPKPLPSFPDPTPDEAELAYAFGTGQRALDALADAEDAKALKSQDEAAEEFDGASTTSDWRRSRMDFEIPEESANKPAFSAVDELESNFSPEKALVHNAPLVESVSQVSVPQQLSVPHNAEVPGAWADPIKEFAPSETISVTEDNSHHAQLPPVVSLVPAQESPADAISAAESVEPAQKIEAIAPPAAETGVEVAVEPEPSFASRATHWMDLMASSASELPPQDWFASAVPPAASVQTATGTELQHEVASIEEPSAPLAQPIPQEQGEHIDASPIVAISLPPSENDSFFADETDEADLKTTAGELPVESVPASEPAGSDVPTETEAEARPVEIVAKDSTELHHGEPTVEASAPREEAADWVSDSEDSSPSYKEPDLIEPPAVHVTPEPLLVAKSHRESQLYGARYEEIRPAHSFQLPTPENRTEEEQSPNHSPAEHSIEQASSPKDLTEERLAPHASLEFPPALFDEHMPAEPSHLREELDEIPYLNPPPDFHEYADGHSLINHFATDSLLVDAVVEKVLQRIEPQLRELLSQNVLKPLIENLLHDELERKHH